MRSRKISVLVTALIITGLYPLSSEGKDRFALVVGNRSYALRPLENPLRDASHMETALKASGFSVDLALDVDQETMEAKIQSLQQKLGANSTGLFYFSGHGVQYEGRNYLIPIGAMKNNLTPGQLRYRAVDLGLVLATMSDAKNRLNLIFLDACRNDPFVAATKSLKKGLARVSGSEGSLISYAAAPGKVAYDGPGRYSPYTESLVKHISRTALPIELLLKEVRKEVIINTDGKQTPWYAASIGGDDFYFKTVRSPVAILSPAPRYTPLALKNRTEGQVVLQAVISETGDVQDIEVIESLEPGLTEAAISAFEQWKFKPAYHNNRPVRALYKNEFVFSLPFNFSEDNN